MEDIQLTAEFKKALHLLEKTHKNVFITGKAGTGKSTLLDYFCRHTGKNVVVLAPTGVAAVNIKGETIHSFFGFKPDITLDQVTRLKNPDAREPYEQIEMLIIDEVSMVRADLFDCMAKFLHLNGPERGRPFGGVQLVLIGDLYQLPPVVTREEREVFSTHYRSPYFFSARNYRQLTLEWIELDRVFRQRDDEFLAVLNAIRNNTVTDHQLEQLNRQVQPGVDLDALDNYIFLTTTNRQARTINRQHLDRLETEQHTFDADIRGEVDSSHFPTDVQLSLKTGAQVMLLNNDFNDRWVNGTIATITNIDPDEYLLTVELPDRSQVDIGPYRWEIFNFELDEDKKQLTPVPVGHFEQFPVRLAWAVTIHKSQGKTFDNVVLDLSRGTFAPGQLYVGLSRCRSLDGLILTRPVKKGHIRLDYRVQEFITGFQYQKSEERLPLEEKTDLIRQAIDKEQDLRLAYLKGNDFKSERIITPREVGTMRYGNRSFDGLRGYCHLRKDERVFRVDRILELEIVGGEAGG